MKSQNKIINGLWIGQKLSAIELLTLNSFVNHGHLFYLWVYNELDNLIPKNVILKDANEIIPESEIFRKKEADPALGSGKGSVAQFADVFRFKLLYQHGGWWVDMDILCLKPLDFTEPYFFRTHPYFPTINNIMKVPKGCKLMKRSYEESNEKINADTKEYLLANEILNKHVLELNLDKYIKDNVCNREWWADIEPFIFSKKTPPDNWYFIHWINEEWRTQKLDKNELYQNSTIGTYMHNYGIIAKLKRTDLKYYSWHIKQNAIVQKIKPLLKKTPIHALYKNYLQ